MAEAAAPAIRRDLMAEHARPATGNTSTLPDDETPVVNRPVHRVIMWVKPSQVKNLCLGRRMTEAAGTVKVTA
jgi:hypothetical protein